MSIYNILNTVYLYVAFEEQAIPVGGLKLFNSVENPSYSSLLVIPNFCFPLENFGIIFPSTSQVPQIGFGCYFQFHAY